MEKKKEMCTKRNTGLVGALYVISVILLLIFVFMLIGNIGYIRNYITSYGMPVSDMVMESVQYVVANSLSYLVYAVLVFCAAKVISIVSCKGAAHDSAEVASSTADIEDIVTDDNHPDDDILPINQSTASTDYSDDVEDESFKGECTDDTQPVENTMAPDCYNDAEVDEEDNHSSDVDNSDEYSDAPNVDVDSVNTRDIIVEKYNRTGVSNAVEQSDDTPPLEHTMVSDYNNDFDTEHDANEGVVIEKADYIYVSNAVESSDEEPQQLQPAQPPADQTPQQDDYRFEADEVISRLGASRQKAHRKGIVEEATENQSE